MAVYLSWDMHTDIISQPISPTTEADYLRRVGDAHHRAAEVVTLLAADGWQIRSLTQGVLGHHPAVRTHAEARERLSDLGIDPNQCSIKTMPKATIRKLFRESEHSDATSDAPVALDVTK